MAAMANTGDFRNLRRAKRRSRSKVAMLAPALSSAIFRPKLDKMRELMQLKSLHLVGGSHLSDCEWSVRYRTAMSGLSLPGVKYRLMQWPIVGTTPFHREAD
jgi:hypothetical protein